MNRIERLISELCPNGVPYVALGSIVQIANRGVDKVEKPNEEDVFLLNYMDVYRNREITPDRVLSKTTATENQIRDCDLRVGDIIITPTSETRDDLAHAAVVITPLPKTVYSYHVMRLRILDQEVADPKYLAYQFRSRQLQSQILGASNGITRFGLTKPKWESLLIQLPPLEVQREIIRVLNSFTALEAELAAELEARKSQYEFYRHHLLSFRETGEFGVRWTPLGDVCEYRKERSKSPAGTFMYVGVEDLLQERQGVSADARFVSSTGHDIFMPGDVLLGNIRPYLKKVWRADVEGRTNGDVLVVTPKQEAVTEIDTSYLYFLLSSDDFFGYCVQTSKGAKMPRGDKQAILRYEIPVPSLETQRRIVNVLTSFESLTQDLEVGLPAEIAARRQQFEYYQNKLLTFKALEVA